MDTTQPDRNDEFDRWPEPYLAALGHKARRRAPTYLRGLVSS